MHPFCKAWDCLYPKFQISSIKIERQLWSLRWRSKICEFLKPRTFGGNWSFGRVLHFSPLSKNAHLLHCNAYLFTFQVGTTLKQYFFGNDSQLTVNFEQFSNFLTDFQVGIVQHFLLLKIFKLNFFLSFKERNTYCRISRVLNGPW